KLTRLNNRLCQSQAQLSILELALDLISAIDYTSRGPDYWIHGGYFRDEDHVDTVVTAAATIARCNKGDPADAAHKAQKEWNIELFAAHCTILEWVAGFKENWRWYASRNEEAETRLPHNFSFQERNEEAQEQWEAESPTKSTTSSKGKSRAT